MAKKVVILGYQQQGPTTIVDCLFWYPIASGQKTQTSGSFWTGASAPEHAAIQAGNVLEERVTVNFPTGLDVTSMKATIEGQWTNRNAILAGLGPSLFNGVFLDGTTGWSA